MGLLKYRWKRENHDKAIRAVARIKNQQTLFEIHSDNGVHYEVRKAAEKRLTDQALIYEIIMQNTVFNADVIDRITDQALLIKIALCGAYYFRESAAKRIEDVMVLDGLAKNDSHWYVREIAHRKLGNVSEADTLIAQNAFSYDERCKAVNTGNISCDELLKICQNNYQHKNVRIAAVKQLTDQLSLTDIAKNNDSEYVRAAAVQKLTDQPALTDIAKNDDSEYVRKEAVKQLTDESALTDIAKKDDTDFVRIEAADKITDQIILAEVLTGMDFYSKDDVKRLCIKITDDVLIKKIAVQCKSDKLRDYCCEKLGGHLRSGDCKCSICGMKIHSYIETGRGDEKDEGGHAVSFPIYYRCSRCGDEKTESGFRYTDW